MRFITKTMVSVAALMLLVSGTALSAEKSIGQAEYEQNCASCHGVKGKGDGPFTEFLKQGIPSLTNLSKNNGGVFPVDRITQYIDGRTWTKAHGSREMPVWGAGYTAESVRAHGPFFGEWYAENVVRARILALVEYISQLQE